MESNHRILLLRSSAFQLLLLNGAIFIVVFIIYIEITPYQDYSYQNWFVNCSATNFTNPLYGAKKTVTMRVDDSDPVVSCGFHDVHIDTPYIEIDGKVLYHRVSSGSDIVSLSKSWFWFNVTVS